MPNTATVCRISASDDRLYRALCAEAKLGNPCPSADDLAEFLGVSSVSTTVAALTRLEQAGMIRIRRFHKARQITITATGDSTAEPTRFIQPHWRDRPLGQANSALKLLPDEQAAKVHEMASIHGFDLPHMIAAIMQAGIKSYGKRRAA